jgi:hypothetical protein
MIFFLLLRLFSIGGVKLLPIPYSSSKKTDDLDSACVDLMLQDL